MPDPILFAQAMGLAFVAAAVLLGICSLLGRRGVNHATWTRVGWVLGVGAGFYGGCWLLEVRPRWPPLEDQDRLLVFVMPAVLAVELLAAFPKVPRWLAWTLRLIVAGSGARVLLHGSSYLVGPAGPGTMAWTPARAYQMLGGLALAAATVWILLVLLARRSTGVSVVFCLAAAIGGSAVTIMLSGYATGGQAGLPLAAALLGASAVALVLRSPEPQTAPIGVAVVGLFSLLVIGHFFGELTSIHAILLFAALLLAWLPELPRGLARVVLVGALVSAVVAHAVWNFTVESKPSPAPGSNDATIEDYTNFGR
jgi:hypothetical protein